MKKFFQSKGFIVSSLALLCITILGVCWFVSRDRTGDFRPDESPPSLHPKQTMGGTQIRFWISRFFSFHAVNNRSIFPFLSIYSYRS